MTEKEPPFQYEWPFLIADLHRADWYIAHSLVKPVFDLIITYTRAEQVQVMQVLLITFIVQSAFSSWWETLIALFGHFALFLIYFVVIPLEMKGSPMLADSRHYITPWLSYSLTNLMFTCYMLILCVFTAALIEEEIKTVAAAAKILFDNRCVTVWLIYHVAQWLDTPVKKSVSEDIKTWVKSVSPSLNPS